MLAFLTAYPWLLAPAIFFARVADVSLGTCRSILVFKGYRILSAGIGFIESLIWILAAGMVFTNLHEWYLIVAYAAGFGMGNYVGIWLESWLGIGSEMVRAISYRTNGRLAEKLRKQGFKPIELSGNVGDEQPIEVVLVVEKRRRIGSLLETIRREDPDAIYTISDIKDLYSGGAPNLMRPTPLLTSGWRIRGKRK